MEIVMEVIEVKIADTAEHLFSSNKTSFILRYKGICEELNIKPLKVICKVSECVSHLEYIEEFMLTSEFFTDFKKYHYFTYVKLLQKVRRLIKAGKNLPSII